MRRSRIGTSGPSLSSSTLKKLHCIYRFAVSTARARISTRVVCFEVQRDALE